MNRWFPNLLAVLGLSVLLAAPGAEAEEPMSATLKVMAQRITESVGKWNDEYKLYVLWPDSKKSVSNARLPKPEGWQKASNGSLEKIVKITSKTVYTARLTVGCLVLSKTMKHAVRGDKFSSREYILLEHDPIFTPGDPQVAAWTEKIETEYDDMYTFYILYPRWLPIPPGWKDAFFYGGSMVPASMSNFENMKGNGKLTFTGHTNKKWKRSYKIIEPAVAESTE